MSQSVIDDTAEQQFAVTMDGTTARLEYKLHGTEVERIIRIAGFDPVRAGGVSASARIEVGGELNPWGGLNGRLADSDEAASLVDSVKLGSARAT